MNDEEGLLVPDDSYLIRRVKRRRTRDCTKEKDEHVPPSLFAQTLFYGYYARASLRLRPGTNTLYYLGRTQTYDYVLYVDLLSETLALCPRHQYASRVIS